MEFQYGVKIKQQCVYERERERESDYFKEWCIRHEGVKKQEIKKEKQRKGMEWKKPTIICLHLRHKKYISMVLPHLDKTLHFWIVNF